ncbi:MAG: tRNA 4-thiouridine(8) synthase ThiI [Oscillospiraceae bacterium]|jgi:thiamine biosynthesis protein ThiI|nr:tRNA 4-thiouridine(8) synthase ThiI [Oscillospiraceae bacterium]
MKEIILLKLGEVVLKGLNRHSFEETLRKNIRRRLNRVGAFDVRERQSTIYVSPRDESTDLFTAQEKLSQVFGVASLTRACEVEKNMDAILNAAAEYLRVPLSGVKTFKVESKRSDKRFPLKSPQICSEAGGFLLSKFPNLKVDVNHPDYIVRIEVRDTAAYVHGNAERGAGGIPVGTGGKAAILISGGIDSPVAAWMMARRGAELTAVHFASPPYTSERAEQKVRDLLAKVGDWAGRIKMYTVPFAKVQEQIMANCPEELFTVIMRRLMMRCSEKIARSEGCGALITGESLGQVASQTMQAMVCTDAAAQMPVFRPLIGMDKRDIIDIANRIDTYELSILPYEDCCTVFTPKHPRTKPGLKFVEKAEEALDCDALVEECVQNAKTTMITPEG